MPTYFCGIADAKDILSSYGASLATDDNRTGTGNPTFQDNAVERAHYTILQYITKYYDATTNLNNIWLKWCCAYFACVELLRRRGGDIPAGLEAKYTELKEFLEDVMEGRALIPEAEPRASSAGMAMSNIYHDQRFRDRKVRAVPFSSSGDQQSGVIRDLDWDSMNYPDHYG